MSRLTWDVIGEREYETGIDRVVLYPMDGKVYGAGVAWSGVSKIDEKPSGGEASDIYADNIKYLSLISAEKFDGSIEAYMSPEEFDACDGTLEAAPGVLIEQQTRKAFGLSYRTIVGNDTDGDDYGSKIHLVWGCKASPSEKSRSTVNDSPEATSLSWEFNTTPVNVTSINPATGKVYKPISHMFIDTTKVSASKLSAFENMLYGTDATYVETSDESFETLKDYFELIGGQYVKTSDTVMSSTKTYYEKTAEGVDGKMPTPDEVISFFKAV